MTAHPSQGAARRLRRLLPTGALAALLVLMHSQHLPEIAAHAAESAPETTAETAAEASSTGVATAPASPGAKPALGKPLPAANLPRRGLETLSGQPRTETVPVRLRAGVHEEYDRLVFDWPSTVAFELDSAIGSARIRFAQPGRLDSSLFDDTRFARLQRVRAVNAAGQLIVELSFSAEVTARVFRLDRRIVVDLVGPQGTPRLAAFELFDEPRPASAPAAEAAPPEPAASTAGKPTQLFPQGVEPPAAPAAPEAAAPAPPKPQAAAPASESDPARPFAPPDRRDAEPSGFRIERIDALGRPLLAPLPGGVAPWPDPIVLRFGWTEPTRAAVMQNGPAVLLVFDRPAPEWSTNRIATIAPELSRLKRQPVEGATALSFEVSTLASAQLHRDGGAWVLDLRPRPGSLDQPLPLTSDLLGRSLQLSTENAGAPVELKDPVTGARIVAVPLGEETGYAPGRRFPEFEIPPSAQGLFVVPLSDRVTVTASRRRIGVGGIDAGSLTTRLQAPEAPVATEPGRRLLAPAAWRLAGRGDYSQVRQELQTAVSTSQTAAEMTAARLALARFYFSQGFARETLGMLQLMFADTPELVQDPELMLMAGASRVLARDYNDAVEILGSPGLAGEPEARLWQAMLAAAAQDWAFAADRFADAFAFAADYARPVRVRIALAAAEARLETGDLTGAAEYLGVVEGDLWTAPEVDRHRLIQGMIWLAQGDTTRSTRLLERVARDDLGAASARARLLLIEGAIANGSLPVPEAIEEIEKLRFAWRGDAFEFALLTRLADLYESEGEIRPALRSLRSAVSNFPGNPGTEAAARRMQALFADQFTGESTADMAPIAALSLYEEFRELMPPGPRGDAIVEGLADRLVAIDLLQRAASLLESQLGHRPSDADRSRIGARLALIRLLDHEPAGALAALDDTLGAAVPSDELRLERDRLRAKALLDLGQGDAALAVLEGDEGPEADRLRVEIHRAAGRWSLVAQTLDDRLPPAGLPLDAAGAAQVLNCAVAHVLAGQRAELRFLARTFGPAMAESRHANAFALLVGTADAAALASIADQLGAVEQAEAFMTDYRTRLAEGRLSALN